MRAVNFSCPNRVWLEAWLYPTEPVPIPTTEHLIPVLPSLILSWIERTGGRTAAPARSGTAAAPAAAAMEPTNSLRFISGIFDLLDLLKHLTTENTEVHRGIRPLIILTTIDWQHVSFVMISVFLCALCG